MNILFATSECAPFIKTGGLADVAGALPKALAAMGHDVRVILPLYEGIGEDWRSQMEYLQCYGVTLGWRSPYCGIFELKREGVTYWFVDNEYYFKRSSLYGHYDDGERFAFFSRAVVESVGHLNWHPDVLHCNDWQTALAPIYLLEERHRIPQLYDTKSVYTIHNIEYQGRYGSQVLQDLFGLNAGYMNEHMLAYHGDVNLMKGAIYAADYVTTVSPTYAEELQYGFYAHGLEGVIADNRHKIRGILNGIDTDVYDPAKDKGLAKNFTLKKLAGKKACKAALPRPLRRPHDVLRGHVHRHLRRRGPVPHALGGGALRPVPDDRHALRHHPHRPGDRRPAGLGAALQRLQPGRHRLHLPRHQRPRHGLGGAGGRGPLPRGQKGLAGDHEKRHERGLFLAPLRQTVRGNLRLDYRPGLNGRGGGALDKSVSFP